MADGKWGFHGTFRSKRDAEVKRRELGRGAFVLATVRKFGNPERKITKYLVVSGKAK